LSSWLNGATRLGAAVEQKMSKTLELKVVLTAIQKVTGPMRQVIDASRGASKALSEAKGAMKELNDQQKLIDKFKATNKKLGINGQDLEKARAYAKQLGEQLQATEKPTVAMQRAFKHATEEARNLAGAVNRLREQKQALRQDLSAAGIDTKSLASHQRDLKGKIEAATAAVNKQDEALKRIKKRQHDLYAAEAVSNKIRAIGSRAGSVGRTAMAGGAALGAAASGPVMAYAEAEQASTQLQVAMMQKGGQVSESFAQIDTLAKNLGNKLPGTTADYQNMMTMLIRQGMPAKSILGGLGEATAYLAVQLKMAPEAAAEFSSKLQDATRTTDKDMMALMDTIQRTFYLGVDQGNMLQGFAKLSPALAILKKDGIAAARELAPLLVMADQSGMAGEAAGNAYRKIFQGGLDAKKVGKGNAALAGTGIKLDFTDGKGEFGGIEKLFSQLDRLKGVSTQKRTGVLKTIFGDDAETLQALSLIIDKGKAGYDEVQKKLADQASLQERVQKQLGTLTSLWDAASGTFKNALVALGESISPELHATAEWIGKLAERTQKWAEENPQLAATLMTLAKWGAMVLMGVGALGLAIAAVSAPIAILNLSLAGMGLNLGMVLGALSKVIGFVANAVKANPWALLFAAGAAAIGHILGRLDELKAKFTQGDWWGIGRVIMEGIIAGFDSLTFGLFSKVLEVIKGITTRIAKALGFNPFPSAGGSSGETGGSSIAPKIEARPSVVQPQPRSAFSGGSNSFVFNIQPSPGMDERGLAGMVRDEFSKITREQEARQRSSLRDQH